MAIYIYVTQTTWLKSKNKCKTRGYATMVHGRGCNPHRCTTTFAKWKLCHYDALTRKL